MSQWKLAVRSPAPLGCVLPASLLQQRLDLAALQDRIKTYTSTQIPVSSHLCGRLNDFLLCLLLQGFLPPCSCSVYISWEKKQLSGVTMVLTTK